MEQILVYGNVPGSALVIGLQAVMTVVLSSLIDYNEKGRETFIGVFIYPFFSHYTSKDHTFQFDPFKQYTQITFII